MGRRRIRERFKRSRRNAMALHERLGKSLGTFELRSRLGGAEDAQSGRAERIHHACGQRRLGANHGQVDFLGLRPAAQLAQILDGKILQVRLQRRTSVARSHIHLGDFFRLRQLPGQRMFTATRADNENFHGFCQSKKK